jgi:beta-glucosidase
MTKITRRDLATMAGTLAGALAVGSVAGSASAAPAPKAARKRVPKDMSFPKDFIWGSATAAYQIEGAVKQDGRGETNWDVFSHTPGKVFNGDTGDVACDSYNRYKEDTALLKNLGVGAYRMSLAWSRIFPEGRGRPNQKGVDHYKRVVDNLLENGITPFVTLFHWDLPTALPGGWQNRDTAYAFADYAGYITEQLSDRVKSFMTTNEIFCFTDLGHKVGIHAPGLKLDPGPVNQVRHHGVLAHGLAVQAIRAKARRGTKVGLAENAITCVPVIETAEHIAAAQKATRDVNAAFLTVILEGKYLDSYLAEQGRDAPKVQAGDMAAIGSPLDFVSINCYTPTYVRADSAAPGYVVLPNHETAPKMIVPWLNVGPEVLYWAVRNVSEVWNPKSMFISENGCPTGDPLKDGRLDDPYRIMYLRNYITQMQRAAAEGYPIDGYFLWTLLDNFEWAEGYNVRFGIHHTDFKTMKRTPKLSAEWYRELIAKNALV